ncbi:MAG TPA: GNAT family N-acetyltransferase [Pyrinomonadaceae bacterium]|nr:GNAT family N-acetyltransferase [Pyrinomonadaceae bacterium]
MTTITIAESDDEIRRCYAVMSELRPHIAEEDFLPQVKRQMAESGFQLIYLMDDGEVKAAAGIRIAEWLARGMSLDLEDLVATESDRSKGYGGELLDWLFDYGRERGCTEIRLVSHVTRFRAHQFYLKKKMILDGHFFSMPLPMKTNT